jgi:hypothetical protein
MIKQSQKMKTYKFTYLHVPSNFAIQMGLDSVQNKTVEIQANSKHAATQIFKQMVK